MEAPRSGTGRNAGSVGMASVVAAGAGYLILFATARLLSLEMNTVFLTYWSLLFLVFGILGGVQNEVTRSVRSASLKPEASDGGPVLPSAILVGACVAALVLVLLPWSSALLPSYGRLGLCFVAFGAVLFSAHCGTNGVLAGQGEWAEFSKLTAAEALLRLLLVVVAVFGFSRMAGAPELQLIAAEGASALGAGAWILMSFVSPRIRAATRARGDRGAVAMICAMGVTIVGNGGSSILLVGFPLLLSLTTNQDDFAMAAPLILAISLTRAPLMMPLNAFQGMVITHFVESPELGRRALKKVLAGICGIAFLGAVAAWLVGPWLMTVVGGPDYRLAGLLLALLVLDAGLVSALTIASSLVLAIHSNAGYSLSWALAAGACVAVLLIPQSLEWRTVMALFIGPAVGLCFALWVVFKRKSEAVAPRSVG